MRVLIEATTRFELVIRVLQTRALPLGYVAIFNYTLHSKSPGKEVADPCLTAWLCRHITTEQTQ